MVKLFLIKPKINPNSYYQFRISMELIFRNGFSSSYNKKLPPNRYLVSNYGKLLFGIHTVWPGILKVVARSNGYFIIGYDEELAVLEDLEIDKNEIITDIATIVGHMELSNQLDIIKDYREQD